MIDSALHIWASVATILILAGAICYLSLLPYMTRD
jgi:hypothetical protein